MDAEERWLLERLGLSHAELMETFETMSKGAVVQFDLSPGGATEVLAHDDLSPDERAWMRS